jgi:glycosyltransferase involved in cell wall biosynthesis
MSAPLVSVVLPIRDQRDHVRGVVANIAQALRGVTPECELILVPNGCRDDSSEVCRALAREHPFVRVIECERPGWGRAVRLGLTEAKGEVLCYTNSARTDPEVLARFVRYALAYPGVVIKANRRIRARWIRRLGSLLYNIECRVLFDLPSWDVNGTPKVFPRSLDKLLTLTRDDDLIDAEFNVVCRREGYAMLEVPIIAARRHGGKSTTTFLPALRMYWGVYRMWRTSAFERRT